MPFDGKSAPDAFPAGFTGEKSLFGLDGGEWRGFFFGLTGIFALVLGMAAVLLEIAGP